MEGIWTALVSGAVGAAIAVVGTFWVQYYFRRRDERQQADRERVAMVLDFTGRARGMVMWAAYIHSHANVTRQWTTQPALLLGWLKAVDLRDFAATYIDYTTGIFRLGGQLVANEGGEIKPRVDEIAEVAFELVRSYLTPVDSRGMFVRWLRPAVPLDDARVSELSDRLVRLTADLERLLLERCRTMKGRDLFLRSLRDGKGTI